jgi:hypothetical protein
MIDKEFEIGEEVLAEGHGEEIFVISSFLYQETYDNGNVTKEESYLLQSKRKRNKLVDARPNMIKRLGINVIKLSKSDVDILLDKYIEYMSVQEALKHLADGFGVYEKEFENKAKDIIEGLKASKIT